MARVQLQDLFGRGEVALQHAVDTLQLLVRRTGRVDQAVRTTIDRVDDTADRVRSNLRVKASWLVGILRGVRAADEPMEDSRYRRAAEWMIEHQNGDGGWGELPASYDESALRGVGPSTPSQTAWGLLSLLACGYGESEAARRGVQYLITTQNASGGWHDDFWTGTGFPKVFYLRYHLYATYFPLWALAEYRRQVTR